MPARGLGGCTRRRCPWSTPAACASAAGLPRDGIAYGVWGGGACGGALDGNACGVHACRVHVRSGVGPGRGRASGVGVPVAFTSEAHVVGLSAAGLSRGEGRPTESAVGVPAMSPLAASTPAARLPRVGGALRYRCSRVHACGVHGGVASGGSARVVGFPSVEVVAASAPAVFHVRGWVSGWGGPRQGCPPGGRRGGGLARSGGARGVCDGDVCGVHACDKVVPGWLPSRCGSQTRTSASAASASAVGMPWGRGAHRGVGARWGVVAGCWSRRFVVALVFGRAIAKGRGCLCGWCRGGRIRSGVEGAFGAGAGGGRYISTGPASLT